MEVKLLQEQVVCAVYKIHMTRDFPAAERKPLSALLGMLREGRYFVYGCYEGERLAAYACLCRSDSGKTLLLDYYAVVPAFRSQGVGSGFLARLREVCGDYRGIVLEIESMESAQGEEEHRLRQRRKDFYLRCGVEETDIFCRVYGVHYQILFFPFSPQWDNNLAYTELDSFYRTFIPTRLYPQKVFYFPPYGPGCE